MSICCAHTNTEYCVSFSASHLFSQATLLHMPKEGQLFFLTFIHFLPFGGLYFSFCIFPSIHWFNGTWKVKHKGSGHRADLHIQRALFPSGHWEITYLGSNAVTDQIHFWYRFWNSFSNQTYVLLKHTLIRVQIHDGGRHSFGKE